MGPSHGVGVQPGGVRIGRIGELGVSRNRGVCRECDGRALAGRYSGEKHLRSITVHQLRPVIAAEPDSELLGASKWFSGCDSG